MYKKDRCEWFEGEPFAKEACETKQPGQRSRLNEGTQEGGLGKPWSNERAITKITQTCERQRIKEKRPGAGGKLRGGGESKLKALRLI